MAVSTDTPWFQAQLLRSEKWVFFQPHWQFLSLFPCMITVKSYCKETGNKGEKKISLTMPKHSAHLMLGIYVICFPRNSSGWCLQVL